MRYLFTALALLFCPATSFAQVATPWSQTTAAAPTFVGTPYAPQTVYVREGRGRHMPRMTLRVIGPAVGRTPPGVVVVEQSNRRALVPGAIALGTSYGAAAASAVLCSTSRTGYCNQGLYWAAVPFVGPFIAAFEPGITGDGRSLLFVDGIIQGLATAAVVYGIVDRQRLFAVRQFASRGTIRSWSVFPGAGSAAAGLTLNVTTQ